MSRLAVVAEQLRANLEQKGVSDVQCGWTGYVNGPTVVTCRGAVGERSFDSMSESSSQMVDVSPSS
jgi:hypothetical protein